MSTRRGFLALLGLAGPAAVLAPKAMLDSGKATDFPIGEATPPPFIGNLVQPGEPMRYLGLAQLKNEGGPVSFDPGDPYFEDEIARFAKEAFRKEQFLWPEGDWEDEA
jgi:hypothetical protein